jgi:hypothetical protein
MSRAWLLVVAGCAGAPPIVDEPIAKPAPALAASETALGPITAKTPANLIALRAALAGYDVFPAHVGGDEVERTLEYQVWQRGEKLMFVVPNEAGTILNVHITSPKVAVANHAWRVGTPLVGATHFTDCACWGAKPVCFKRGEHVAVTFAKTCGATRGERRNRVLEGAPIAAIIWSPRPFGSETRVEDIDEEPDYPDPCGP